MKVIILSLLISVVLGNVFIEPLWKDNKSFDVIRGSIKSSDNEVDCNVDKCCEVSDTNKCSLADLTKSSTLVFPNDDQSQCIFGSPYAFQVIRGSSDKLLFYFQGGGACWSQGTTVLNPLCTTDIRKQLEIGIFDRVNPNNQFKDYTIVMPIYCSGDIWAGNITQSYSKNSKPVVQVGYNNAKVTLDWVSKQQQSGALATVLSNLVIMGCSAGSIGAQLWANTVLSTLKFKSAAVVPDSYAGVFPDGSEGPLMASFGVCSTPLIPPSLENDCLAQKLTLKQIMDVNIAKIPNIPYAFIQSKIDEVQMSFYVSIGITTNTSAVLTPSSFYAKTNEIFGSYNSLDKNFVTFLVDGPQHCFTDQEVYYTADGLGPDNNSGKDGAAMMLYDWVNTLPLQAGDSISSQCIGELSKSVVMEKSNEIIDLTDNENTLCDASVYPKTFIQE